MLFAFPVLEELTPPILPMFVLHVQSEQFLLHMQNPVAVVMRGTTHLVAHNVSNARQAATLLVMEPPPAFHATSAISHHLGHPNALHALPDS